MDLTITKEKTPCQGSNEGGFRGRKRLIEMLLSRITISNIRIRKMIKQRSQLEGGCFLLRQLKQRQKPRKMSMRKKMNYSQTTSTLSRGDFDVLCNVVYVFPREYNYGIEVVEIEDCEEDELVKYKPVCYFVMNNICIEEKNSLFERPHEGMKSHIKPLFIREKVEGTTVNKTLVDGGTVVNLMPHFLLAKVGKFNTCLRPHNMVLSNY